MIKGYKKVNRKINDLQTHEKMLNFTQNENQDNYETLSLFTGTKIKG